MGSYFCPGPKLGEEYGSSTFQVEFGPESTRDVEEARTFATLLAAVLLVALRSKLLMLSVCFDVFWWHGSKRRVDQAQTALWILP